MESIEQRNMLYIEKIKLQAKIKAECDRHIAECEALGNEIAAKFEEIFEKKFNN